MAERTCPLCKKRPVWRTNHSNNWRHLCKRCYHKAWAADQKAQRAARRVTRDAGRRLRGRPLVLVASGRGDRRDALEGLAIGVDAWWPLEDAMAARHPARGEPPIVRQGSPEAQDILVSIRPTRNDHPPGSVYAIMRTLGSCGDDDGCAMQVSPSGREVPGVLCPQGLPVRLPETQTASRRVPGSAGNPRQHGKSEAAFFIRWPVFVQKSPCARQDGRDGQQALPRGTTSRGFSRPKMPETCLRSHGKGVWQTCVPRPIFLATSFCDATRHTKPKTL